MHKLSSATIAAPSVQTLFNQPIWQRLAETLSLSPRELQIVQRIFEDKKEYAIALELGISPHTVNTYVQRLYRKLNTASRTQLVVHVFETYLSLDKVKFTTLPF